MDQSPFNRRKNRRIIIASGNMVVVKHTDYEGSPHRKFKINELALGAQVYHGEQKR